MAKIQKKPHIVTVGKLKFKIDKPDQYGNIGDLVGVKLMNDGDVADYRTTVKELQINGAALHLSCRTESKKTHRILCATTKIAIAVTALINKTLPETSGNSTGDKKIISVTIPRKRTRY